MSVTNGERLVTKQDLADMYQGILPYLGGMPEVLANKFSKGDMYSTDEKMIGQWIDGKPLYQLVVPYSFTGVTARTYVNVLNMTSYNIDTFVGTKGYIINSNSDVKTKPFPLSDQIAKINAVYDRTTKYLQLLTYEINNWTLSGHIIVQYTKTTDSAISIGSDTDYSTEEKVVGTWIDGRPVYQKTVEITNIPNNNMAQTPHNISNLDIVIKFEGMIHVLSTVATFTWTPLPRIQDNSTTVNIGVDILKTSIQLKARSFDATKTFDLAYVTLQYTKTTD